MTRARPRIFRGTRVSILVAVGVGLFLSGCPLATGSLVAGNPFATSPRPVPLLFGPTGHGPSTREVPYSGSSYWINGTVTAASAARGPVAGVAVTVVGRPCSGIASVATCPYVAANTTNSSGFYSVLVPPGYYFVYANNTTSWGGDWSAVTVTSSDLTVNLLGYPWITFGNATFVLPDWNNLSRYASNCNAQGPCGSGVYGTQCPLLSWTDDGVYYVNATGRLVHFWFSNQTVQDVGYWRYLYDDLMDYQGIENTDWITEDGSYVYEFGCSSDCSSATHPSLFAINTTTGRTFNHTFLSVPISALTSNTQLNLIGEDGNSSVAVLMGDGSSLVGYNLWNNTEWNLGTLSYFEANNNYWIPQYNSFFNIEADGSSGDHIQQLRLEGPAPGTRLVPVYTTTFASQFTVNGVNGMYTNVTAHTLVVSELMGGGPVLTQRFNLDRSGQLTGSYLTYADQTFGHWPDDSVPPNTWSSEHRPTVVSDGPMFNGIWNGLFDNNSWLFEPSSGRFLESNLTYDLPGYGSTLRESSQNPAAVEGLFSNTSYSIISESVNCRHNGTTCPIRGTAGGTVAGTIWWSWKSGLPEFPFPTGLAGAETLPPSPVILTVRPNDTTVALSWIVPASDANRVVNYTLFWGVAGGPFTNVVDLWGQNRSETVGGLLPQTAYSFCLEAWNLHWHNACAPVNVTTTPPVPSLDVGGITASPGELDLGTSTVLRLNVTGGRLPYSVVYSGLPPGCPSVNSTVLTCSPGAQGSYRIVANVTDSSGQAGTTAVSLTVGPPLAVQIRTTTPVVDAPETVSLDAMLTAPGTPPYTFQWDLPTGAAPGANVSVAVPTAGNTSVSVTVIDQFQGRANTSLTLRAFPFPSVMVQVAPAGPRDVGLPFWVNASGSGGDGTLSVDFVQMPLGCAVVAPGAAYCRGVTVGANLLSVSATDTLGISATWSGSVEVVSDPIVTLSSTPTSAVLGTPISLSASVAGGVAPYRSQFAGLPPGCQAPTNGNLSFECLPSQPGSYRLSITVVDTDGLGSNSSVVVQITSASPSASTPDWEWLLAGGAAVAIAAAGLLVARRGRRDDSRGTEPSIPTRRTR
ncbi:MAG TPA: fibronectin type III domain-containing protein [Thermoplasmata archaeon]|nr:fibronectin type III domain-containing protein [Thermoplasmata archaeon]